MYKMISRYSTKKLLILQTATIISPNLIKKNMQINFHQKNLHLSDSQKDYMTAKIMGLEIFKVMEDPSVVVKVDIEYHDHNSSDKKIVLGVTVAIPQDTLRAETDCSAPEEGIDLIEAKLRHQLEKYKDLHQ